MVYRVHKSPQNTKKQGIITEELVNIAISRYSGYL